MKVKSKMKFLCETKASQSIGEKSKQKTLKAHQLSCHDALFHIHNNTIKINKMVFTVHLSVNTSRVQCACCKWYIQMFGNK